MKINSDVIIASHFLNLALEFEFVFIHLFDCLLIYLDFVFKWKYGYFLGSRTEVF